MAVVGNALEKVVVMVSTLVVPGSAPAVISVSVVMVVLDRLRRLLACPTKAYVPQKYYFLP